MCSLQRIQQTEKHQNNFPTGLSFTNFETVLKVYLKSHLSLLNFRNNIFSEEKFSLNVPDFKVSENHLKVDKGLKHIIAF